MSADRKFTIYVHDSMHSPSHARFYANFSPLDDGESLRGGSGKTVEAAIVDLVENYDLPETQV